MPDNTEGYDFTKDNEAIRKIQIEERNQRMWVLRQEGKTYEQIGQITGTNRETARRACIKLGAPLYRPVQRKDARNG